MSACQGTFQRPDRPVLSSFCSEDYCGGAGWGLISLWKPGSEHTVPGDRGSSALSYFPPLCICVLRPEASGARGPQAHGARCHRSRPARGEAVTRRPSKQPVACQALLVLSRSLLSVNGSRGHVRTWQMENWLLLIKRNRVVNCCGGRALPHRIFCHFDLSSQDLLTSPED